MGHAKHDERPEQAIRDAAAGPFARLLGERWQTTGDGIYILADDAEEAAEDSEQTPFEATAVRPKGERPKAPDSTRR